MDLTLNSVNGDHKETVKAYVLPKFPSSGTIIDWSQHMELWDHLNVEEKPVFMNLEPELMYNKLDVIIGNNAIETLAVQKSAKFNDNHRLLAELTALGWTVRGPLPKNFNKPASSELTIDFLQDLQRNDEYPPMDEPFYEDLEGEIVEIKLNLIRQEVSFPSVESLGFDKSLVEEINGVRRFNYDYLVKKFSQSLDIAPEIDDQRLDNVQEMNMKEYMEQNFRFKDNKVFAGIPLERRKTAGG